MSMLLTVNLKESGGQKDPDHPGPAGPGNYFNAGGLPYAAVDLDRLIERSDIRPFSDYVYGGDMLSEEEYAEMGQTPPERQWFEPTDGLRTVEHLIGLLEQRDPEAQFESCTVADLLYELQVVHAILRRAKELGEPFSFEVA